MKQFRWKVLVPVVFAISLLAGCSLGGGNTNKQEESAVLKVMYYDERAFYDQYGMLFYALHPEVEFEVISTQSIRWEDGKDMDAAMLEFIEEEQPDIVMLQPQQFTKLAEEGKLLDLDTYIEEKSFDKEGLLPGLLDYMRELGGGKVYGLVPSFFSQVIYYNIDLFEKYGVDLPTDKMSWDELLRLAAMFPTDGSDEERVYGLKVNYGNTDLFQLGSMIGTAQNLNFVDASGQHVTINSDAWKRVFETAHAAIKSGSLYSEEPNRGGMNTTYEDYLLSEPFVGGKVAMAIEPSYLMDQIKQAQNLVPDKAVQNWDLVTMPIDPSNPEVSPYMSFNQIFAISSKSTATKTAWRFLSYIHSDEFARVTAKRQFGNMSVRTKYLKDDEGHNFAAFYALKPVQSSIQNNYNKLPREFMMNFMGMMQGQISAFTLNEDNEKSISEVLDELQQQGQEALMLALQNQQSSAVRSSSSASSSTTE